MKRRAEKSNRKGKQQNLKIKECKIIKYKTIECKTIEAKGNRTIDI